MSMLSQVQSGIKRNPFLVVGYGVDGVGKSTIGSEAPDPIFIGPERGSENLDVTRLSPSNWTDLLNAVDELGVEQHSYKTLVLDTLDWIEPLIHAHICQEYSVSSIELAAGGYGKGYTEAVNQWRRLQEKLTYLRDAKQMNILALAHSQVSEFNDPATEQPYNRYELKLHRSKNGNTDCRALWREYVDAVVFCNFVTFTKGEGSASRAVSENERRMYTERHATYDAKNRFGMDAELPMVKGEMWSTLMGQVDRFYNSSPEDKDKVEKVNVSALLSEVEEMANRIEDTDTLKKVLTYIESNKENEEALKATKERLLVILQK